MSGGGDDDEGVERRGRARAAPCSLAGEDSRRPTRPPPRARRDAAPCGAPSGGRSRSARGAAWPAPPRARRWRGGRPPGRRSTKRSTLLEVDPPFGVRDQRDRELVDPRIARERPARRAPAAPGSSRAAGSRGPRGCAPGRRGSCRAATRRPARCRRSVSAAAASRRVRLIQDAPGAVEPREQRGIAGGPLPSGRRAGPRATARARSARCSAPSSSPRIGPARSSSRASLGC